MLFRRRAHPRQVLEMQMNVVENVRHIAIGQGARWRNSRKIGMGYINVLRRPAASWSRPETAGLIDAELRDDLRLAFVEKPKVVLAQVSDGMALAVAHHHGH